MFILLKALADQHMGPLHYQDSQGVGIVWNIHLIQ